MLEILITFKNLLVLREFWRLHAVIVIVDWLLYVGWWESRLFNTLRSWPKISVEGTLNDIGRLISCQYFFNSRILRAAGIKRRVGILRFERSDRWIFEKLIYYFIFLVRNWVGFSNLCKFFIIAFFIHLGLGHLFLR